MVLTMVPTAFAETEAGAGNTADTETSVTGLPEAGADGVITLTENVEISSAQWPVMSEGLTIDLQQYTLTISGGSTIYIPQGQTLTIKNGKIIANEFPNGITAVFSAKEDASIILNSVQMMTNGSALFPAGNAASVEVTDSEISAGTYAVGTNASGNLSDNVSITLKDSEFSAAGYMNNDRDTCTVMINVPGTLDVDNCTVTGGRQAVVVRGGTANIVDSEIILSDLYAGTDAAKYDETNWSSGNNLPMAALVVGNRVAPNGAYKYPATCSLQGTTVTAPEGSRTVYVYGMTSEQDIDRSVSFAYDEDSSVGDVVNPEGSVAVAGAAVAEIDGVLYPALETAMAAAVDNDTVILKSSVSECNRIDIADGRNITVDLNGFDIVFAPNSSGVYNSFYITHGALTLTGSGKISESVRYYAPVLIEGSQVSTEKNYSVLTVGEDITLEGWAGIMIDYNAANAAYGVEVNLDGMVSSLKDASDAYGHAVYINGTVKQAEGTVPVININPGAKVNAEGNGNGIYAAGYAEWNIDNAYISGGTGIEIRAGKMNVENNAQIIGTNVPTTVTPNGNGSTTEGAGIAIAQHTTKLPIDVVINDGTISGFSALYQSNPEKNESDAVSKVKLTVNGGNFKAINGGTVAVYSENCEKFISDGYFTSDPSEYTADGYIAVASDKNGYAYKVEKKTETAVPVEPAVGESNVSDLPEEIPEEAVDAVKEAAANIAVPEISAAAAAEANQISDEQASEIKQNSKFYEADDAKVKVRAYLDIKPEVYSEDSYKLNITPVYEIVVASGGEEDVVEEARPLDIKGTTTVLIPLPAEFVTSADDVYVQHKGYEYIAEVTNTGDNYTATFTNPHGFSEFTITKEPAAEAVLNGVRYNTLEDALDAAKDGETVTVLKDGLSADMSGNSRTITLKNDTDNEIKVTVNGKEYLIDSTGVEVSYTRPSSGGGGSVTTYAVTVEDTDNGTVTASVKSASKGSTVTLTVKPDEGYQLDKLTVTDKDGKEISVTEKEDGKYTFTMPASEVSVSAAFTKSEEKPEQIAGFTDVLTTDWFADAVQYAVDNGMMNGTSEMTFHPNGTTTRGMIVTILYRLEKEPAVDNGAGFADVAADQYYADAVAWASANDIVTGYSEEKFGPDNSITREQFAAILYRYAQYKKIDVTATADLSGYADAAQISAYAETAMKWANGEGLITGVTDTMLKPAGNATRAQAATILMRFCEEVAK